MKNKLSKKLTILVVFVGLLVLFIGYLKLGPVEDIERFNYENWSTYSNVEHDFSFKYPQDWELSEKSGDNYNLSVVSLKSSPDPSLYDVSVYWYPDHDQLESREIYKKIGNIEVGGYKGIDVMMSGNYSSYNILIPRGSDLFEIKFSKSGKDYLTEVDKQVLASFEF